MGTKDTRQKLNIHLHKSRHKEESPLIAIQKIHLFRKQKAFLAKQAKVFEKKSQTLKEQVKELEDKIKNQKDLAVSIVKNLEVDKADKEVEAIENKRVFKGRSKPDRTFGQKAKNFFKLDY